MVNVLYTQMKMAVIGFTDDMGGRSSSLGSHVFEDELEELPLFVIRKDSKVSFYAT